MSFRKRAILFVTFISVVFASLACGSEREILTEEELALASSSSVLPQIPVIQRNVAPMQNGEFVEEHIPPLRTSADGRVAMNMVGHNDVMRFHLNVPEKLTQPVLEGSGGVNILADLTPYTDSSLPPESGYASGLGHELFHSVDPALFGPDSRITHSTICDGTTDESSPRSTTNPYACGEDLTDDCYDLTVVAAFRFGAAHPQHPEKTQLWGTPITVTVSNPKTAQAQISNVQVREPVGGPLIQSRSMFEPMITKDGKLLVARASGTMISWPDDYGNIQSGRYDLVYSVAPEAAARCDVTQWSQLFPMSHAPYHSEMKGRYGIAAYPFLDPEGTPIPDGEDMEVSYPWVDRDGDNILFTTTISTLNYLDSANTATTRYPSKCLSQYAAFCITPQDQAGIEIIEGGGFTRGIGVAGLWTHGKLIVLDNIINNTDYALKNHDGLHRLVKLYEADVTSADPDSGWVRVGSARDNSTFGAPPGFSRNTNVTDSLEHLFNYNQNMKPQTLRDVVWTVNSGRRSADVVFDDYVNPNGFIVAEMGASFTFGEGMPTHGMRHNDGFEITGNFRGNGFNETVPIRLQNAATATVGRWRIPSYGAVEHGRIEPVALGGIEGKGLWMNGTTRVRFAVEQQPNDPKESDWFVGLFIDSRSPNDTIIRRLITFADGTSINIRGQRNIVLKSSSGQILKKFWLPTTIAMQKNAWTHLGFGLRPNGKTLQIYVNGMLLRTWKFTTFSLAKTITTSGSGRYPKAQTTANSLTSLDWFSPGEIILGSQLGDVSDGFIGWVDDFKVFAERPGSELACNYARGTLVQLLDYADSKLTSVANAYPAATHAQISNVIKANSDSRFLCFVDYTKDNGVAMNKLPAASVSVREQLIFPEGQFSFGQPRPDSSKNTFCLSCHVSTHTETLDINALVGIPGLAVEDDSRRQPMQHNRKVYGTIPVDLFSIGAPSQSIVAPSHGVLIDEWIFP
ncbi:MAG: hypothetical protein VYC39_11845 [Myxococcota bacterium]|nr:hypothetical protein [Myxococcota bacterium]